jgi:hypothetical protein
MHLYFLVKRLLNTNVLFEVIKLDTCVQPNASVATSKAT